VIEHAAGRARRLVELADLPPAATEQLAHALLDLRVPSMLRIASSSVLARQPSTFERPSLIAASAVLKRKNTAIEPTTMSSAGRPGKFVMRSLSLVPINQRVRPASHPPPAAHRRQRGTGKPPMTSCPTAMCATMPPGCRLRHQLG
jgi:hypothetical protein